MTLTAPEDETAALPSAMTAPPEPDGDRAAEPQPVADGPYVDMAAGGWRARWITTNGSVVECAIETGAELSVPPADGVIGFSLPLRARPTASPAAIVPLADNVPLLVVADTHGELGILVALLQSQGIVDEALGWSFGQGHVAVLGDVVDRGAHQIEILWLIYKLEAEAHAAGGALHFLLGNHEALMLRGDKRYLHPRYDRSAAILGKDLYHQLLGPDDVLGAWLRSRNAILKLGDNLLVHGGLSPALIDNSPTIAQINATVRANLEAPHVLPPEPGDMSADREGPLWYRGYFRRRGKRTSDADVGRSLDHFGVKRIFVGHTPVDRAKPKFRGRVIAVHVYPERHKVTGAPLIEAVLRLNGRLLRVDATGQRRSLRAADAPQRGKA